MYIYEGNN